MSDIYAELDDLAGPKLHTWHKQATLAAKLNMSARTLQRKLGILYADGFIRKRPYAGDRTINDYCLAMVEAKLGIAADARSVALNTTAVVAFKAPYPIKEPVQEPLFDRASAAVSITEPEPATVAAPPVKRQAAASQEETQDPEVARVLLPLLLMYAQTFAMRDWHGNDWAPDDQAVVSSILASGGGRGNLYRIGAYLKDRYGDAVRNRRKIESPGWLVMVVRNHFTQGDNPRPACQPVKPVERAAVAAPVAPVVPQDMAFVQDTLARLAGIGRMA